MATMSITIHVSSGAIVFGFLKAASCLHNTASKRQVRRMYIEKKKESLLNMARCTPVSVCVSVEGAGCVSAWVCHVYAFTMSAHRSSSHAEPARRRPAPQRGRSERADLGHLLDGHPGAGQWAGLKARVKRGAD